MKNFVLMGAIGLLATGTAQAADVLGFQRARFGADEKEIIAAAVADLGVKDTDIKRTEDFLTKTTVLEAKVAALSPIDAPATVTYVLGYSCHCLTRVGVLWNLPKDITEDRQKVAIANVKNLADLYMKQGWEKTEVITERAVGDIKEGKDSALIFFRAQNKKDEAIMLMGTPVKMKIVPSEVAGKEKDIQIDTSAIKNVALSFDKNVTNPDVFRFGTKKPR